MDTQAIEISLVTGHIVRTSHAHFNNPTKRFGEWYVRITYRMECGYSKCALLPHFINAKEITGYTIRKTAADEIYKEHPNSIPPE